MMAEKDGKAAPGKNKHKPKQNHEQQQDWIVQPHVCKSADGKCRKKPTKKHGLYIHPPRPDLKPIKVSCVTCLAGHRSGECTHYDRILLKIRSAGRPSQACYHSKPCNGLCLKSEAYYVKDGEHGPH